MLIFPNAKINLGLHITAKLPNGYHAIESCLYPVPWHDVLEWVEVSGKTQLTVTGADFAEDPKQNLVFKAYKLLQKDFQLPSLNIHLHKVIPSGAGLGGGSADAAFMLKSLNRHFDLFLDDELVEDYAAQLGSDCPFFVKNVPQIATGQGEVLKPLPLSLQGGYATLVKPDINIATKAAYAGVTPRPPKYPLTELLAEPLTNWKDKLVNDFEPSVFAQYPALAQLKEKLYAAGAVYASLSGSGATVYALSERPLKLGKLAENWLVWEGPLA